MLQIIIVQNWHIKTSHGEHNFHILPANYLLWVLKEFNSSQHFDDRCKKKKKRKKRKEKNISWIKQGWIYPKDKILPCIRILKSGFFFFFSLIEYHDIFQKKKKKKCLHWVEIIPWDLLSGKLPEYNPIPEKWGPTNILYFLPFLLRNKNMVKRENSILPYTNMVAYLDLAAWILIQSGF